MTTNKLKQGPQPAAGPAAATGAKIGSPRRLTASAKQSVQTILATWALRELLARRLALPHRRTRKREEQACPSESVRYWRPLRPRLPAAGSPQAPREARDRLY